MQNDSKDRAENDAFQGSGEEADYLSRIQSQYTSLTKSQKKIADYLSRHPDEVLRNSITALSRKIGTNPPSLTRFFQALSYKGFGEFKFLLEKAMVSPPGAIKEVHYNDNAAAIKQKLMALHREAIGDTLLLLDEHLILRAAKAVANCGKLHIYADGGPGATATFAHVLFLQIGLPCTYFTDHILSMMAAGQLQKDDVAVGITYSGTSHSVLDAMEIAGDRLATTIGITAHANSSLAKHVNIPLCYSLKIADDLRYLHVARMCEVAILGFMQSIILNQMPKRIAEYVKFPKFAIAKARRKISGPIR